MLRYAFLFTYNDIIPMDTEAILLLNNDILGERILMNPDRSLSAPRWFAVNIVFSMAMEKVLSTRGLAESSTRVSGE
jgi:hypothetical protein